MNIHPEFQWKRLTPKGAHHFFGYYDRCAWNHDQTLHLTLKVTQRDRLPTPGETAEIGTVNSNGIYTPLTTTRAWCHQQGCMTLWLKHRPDCFIYNDFDETSGKLIARIYRLEHGIDGTYERPIYAISPDGRWGASLNFARIPRRGYTYADALLPREYWPDLDNDGIFRIDLHSGETRLLVPFRKMFELHPTPYTLEDMYVWLNHIIFNCDGSRLLWLLRHCNNTSEPFPWYTHMFTVGINGEDLRCPLPEFYWNGMISHQIWGRTPHEILIDARWGGQNHDCVVFDERELPLRAQRLSSGMGPMAHLVFSPDGKWMLADSYPDGQSRQRLALINSETGAITGLGKFHHCQSAKTIVDVRCDLHPRWSPDGRIVTVDSIHDGETAIYMLDVGDIIDKIQQL
eukprot:TRINITY_DN3421_c0_g1_i4.p1 TRINITY_DN3421_c0_g1~~TRINITY_DN3421_c0_g1_i4.p1  ORF type:complete len:401 (-),score=74.59 TRINITY_DN3421_c0_g1_i4:1499-2701(-)